MIELHNIYIYPCKISKTVKVIEKISIGFFVTPFNYSARYPTGYPARPDIQPDWISGRIPDIRQNILAGYPAAGYPANSVSGATLLIFNNFKPISKRRHKTYYLTQFNSILVISFLPEASCLRYWSNAVLYLIT